MMEDEGSSDGFAQIWIYLGMLAGFVGLPVSAYMLWGDHRGLAWIAIIATLGGVVPYLGLPMAVGFIVYAVTENETNSIVAAGLAIALAYGPLFLAEHLRASKIESEHTSSGPDNWPSCYGGSPYDNGKQASEPALPLGAEPPMPAQSPFMAAAFVSAQYCGQCGAPGQPGDKFCQSCGNRLSQSPQPVSGKTSGSLALTQPLLPSSVLDASRSLTDTRQRILRLRKLWSFKGRISRKDFVIIWLALWIAMFPLLSLSRWAQTSSCPPTTDGRALFRESSCTGFETFVDQYSFPVFLLFFVVFWLWIGWVAQVKRAHDFGWSGWVTLILTIVPIVGAIFFLVLLVRPGDDGDNHYGVPNGESPFPILHR